MGYSIYVEAKNKELQNKMYGFLEKNMKNLCKEIYYDENATALRLCKGDEISYLDHDLKYPIGFDYGPIDDAERVYVYEIIKWVVSKITDKKYYYYDHEPTLVQDRTPKEMYDHFKRQGWLRRKKIKQIVSFIQSELKNLDELWEKDKGV
jgi:hypothetical protein